MHGESYWTIMTRRLSQVSGKVKSKGQSSSSPKALSTKQLGEIKNGPSSGTQSYVRNPPQFSMWPGLKPQRQRHTKGCCGLTCLPPELGSILAKIAQVQIWAFSSPPSTFLGPKICPPSLVTHHIDVTHPTVHM